MVRYVESAELRNTPMETKLTQLAALMSSRDVFGPEPDREAQLRDVRERWARVYAERDAFAIVPRVDGREMFEPLFDYAAELEAGEPYDPAAAARLIDVTFEAFVR